MNEEELRLLGLLETLELAFGTEENSHKFAEEQGEAAERSRADWITVRLEALREAQQHGLP